MSNELRTVIFQGGQSDHVDPRVGDAQAFRTVQNARFRKDGRAAKRYGTAALTTTAIDSRAFKHANAITQWQGSPLLVLDSTVRVPYSGSAGAGSWSYRGDIARFMPGRRDPVARDEVLGTCNGTVACANGYLVYLWDDGDHTVWNQIRTASGAIASDGAVATGTYPQAVTVGSKVWYAVKRSTPRVDILSIDCSTSAFTTSFATLGALASTTAYLDTCALSSTQWLVAYQTAANTITVALLTGSTTTATATATTTTATPQMSVHYSASTNAVFLAWDDNGDIKVKVFSATLGAVLAAETIISAATVGSNNRGPLTFCDFSVTEVRLAWCWNGALTGPITRAVKTATLSTAASIGLGSVQYVYHQSLSSKLFNGPQGTRNAPPFDGGYAWTNTFNRPGYWDTQRNYFLVSMPTSGSSNAAALQLSAVGSMQATNQDHLSPVVLAGDSYVTFLPNALRTHFGASATETLGHDSVSFASAFNRQRDAHRQAIEIGRATHFCGGILAEYVGIAEETAFMHAPLIEGFALGAGIIEAGAHSYVAVFELIDSQGRRHRSAPSAPFLVTLAGASTVTLTFSTLGAGNSYINGQNPGPYATVHIYRTTAGGTTYYRCTPNLGAPIASSSRTGNPTATFSDNSNDGTISVNEILYTDGGVLPNVMPPASRFGCAGGARMWLGGTLEPNKAVCSKIVIDGEPVQFTDSDAFSVFFPEPLTGLVWMDGALIGFTSNGIYIVSGDGPNDQGVGSFSEPRRLPTDVGCIDYRSLVESPQGVFFQSKRGIYLLPRGFNPPVLVGADVQSTLNQYPIVNSAVQVVEPGTATGNALPETTIRFSVTESESAFTSKTLVFDTRTNSWAVDTSNVSIGVSGVWSDVFTFAQANVTATDGWLRQEHYSFGDSGEYTSIRISTGDYRPFGLAGYGKFHRVAVLGEYRDDCTLHVDVSVDGRFANSRTFDLVGQTSPSQEGTFYVEVTPEYMTGTSISVDVYDASSGAVSSEGIVFHGITIETEDMGRARRLGSGSRA